ncbi:unnamed protein product [Oppiella nova]|uniref:C-type lectin domain-containing protein n=1 Tax=Oppiella nova TaxID=334625 RepID=A0A7R9QH32_9ACAR|nr:unnamed protein product [Oppiella nova]CAG2165698.1 unnamed protein product [Oppiella nova]
MNLDVKTICTPLDTQDDKCYYHILNKNATQAQAKNMCKVLNKDAILATIGKKSDESAISLMLSTLGVKVWLGLEYTNDGKYRWVDGSTTDFYTNWMSGNNTAFDDTEGSQPWGNCTYLALNEPIGLATCYAKDLRTTDTSDLRRICTPTDDNGHEKCYYYLPYGVANQTQAAEMCRVMDETAILGTIHTKEQENIVALLLVGTKVKVWLGMEFDKTRGAHRWVDGIASDYENWKSGTNTSFNDTNGHQPWGNCAYLLHGENFDASWYTSNCTMELEVLCQTNNVVKLLLSTWLVNIKIKYE